MDVTVERQSGLLLPIAEPMPVVLVLGSGRTAKALSQALASEQVHTVLGTSWTQVRALAGFIRPDLVMLVPAREEELAWRSCFGRDVPDLVVSQLPGVVGLRWPVRWRTLVVAVKQRIAHGPALALIGSSVVGTPG